MAKQKKKDFSLTVSGCEYDKELSRVPIKVYPALQAMIANQHDLIEVFQKYAPEKSIFLEAHRAELVDLEETIAKEHAKYCVRREEHKKKRQGNGNGPSEKDTNGEGPNEEGVLPKSTMTGCLHEEYDEPLKKEEALLDEIAASISPGLPSSRYAPALSQTAFVKEEIDIRRIAVGASIKALSKLLGRLLTDQEIAVIEKQVDAYL
jgi:hypothetical protein